MKTLLTSWIVGASLILVSGCAVTPAENPWDDIELQQEVATDPQDCGEFPLPDVVDATSNSITYDVDGTRKLDLYRECAAVNQAVAVERTDEVNQHRIAEAALVDAGKHQRAIAEMRREMLEEERRARAWNNVTYWVLIGLLGAAAL